MKDSRDIIIEPLITEKTTNLMEENKYCFKVDKRANKIEIKKAVEDIFGVQVEAVNTMNMKGKPKRFGVHRGYTSSWKKAIVTLKEGSKTIELFE